MTTTRKQYSGCYRITLSDRCFGQITKHHREWLAEIRYTDTGDLKRYAGVWATKKAAIEELTSINKADL